VTDGNDVVASGYSRSDHAAAADLAARAGRLLRQLQQDGPEGKELGAEGDRRSHELLTDLLAERFPRDRIRSEEDDQAEALTTDVGRVWIIDPLDGTREFSERRADWARLVMSRTRPPDFVPAVAERLGAETVPMGSAGAKISAVVRGEAEVYVHAGGQYEWDSCAPVAVALAAGLHASRLDGTPLRYARPDPWLPDLVVCHPLLADAVLGAVRGSGALDGG